MSKNRYLDSIEQLDLAMLGLQAKVGYIQQFIRVESNCPSPSNLLEMINVFFGCQNAPFRQGHHLSSDSSMFFFYVLILSGCLNLSLETEHKVVLFIINKTTICVIHAFQFFCTYKLLSKYCRTALDILVMIM